VASGETVDTCPVEAEVEALSDRPVRLTFPAREPGARKIMADGLQVGHMLASYEGPGWTAYLWAVRSDPHMGVVGEVRGRNLAEARDAARKRLEVIGPWWTC